MRAHEDRLPQPVLRRLPRYLIRVNELKETGTSWVSSSDLANALGLTSSTVRQDLSHLDLMGVSKRGYDIMKLEAVLHSELGGDSVHTAVIVGAGYLGCALALHGALARQGFEVVGVFDKETEIIGTTVGPFSVRPMTALRAVIRNRKVSIGILAVPAAAAQEVADQLIAAGVKGLLNLAYVQIRAPQHVAVMDARIIASLQELAYMIRTRDERARL